MNALRGVVNKYGIGPKATEDNFKTDPNMGPHAGETSLDFSKGFPRGISTIGTNPNESLQYSGSVIKKGQDHLVD